MMLIKTYLDKDAFGGTGIFADEDIKAGQVIWRYNPDVDKFYSIEEYLKLPEDYRKSIDKHIYREVLDGVCGIMYNTDNGRFFNHSNNPNTGNGYSENGLVDSDICVANCDIKKGTELTCDYKEFFLLPEYDMIYGELGGVDFKL
jgi:uncharacterized protein